MPTTLIGVIVAIATSFAVMFTGGMDPVYIFFGSPGSVALVVVGTLAATIASSPGRDVGGAFKSGLGAMFKDSKINYADMIETVTGFADRARKEGVLSLDKVADEIEDPFLARGIRLIVDGTDPSDTREILDIAIETDESKTAASMAFWTKAAGYAPAFGVFGTVIGLIDMLRNLEDPSTLGPALAVAFVTTLWGVFLANFFFQPIAFKMERNSKQMREFRDLQLDGVLSIQRGMNPRSLKEKLETYVPASKKQSGDDKGS